MTTTTELKLCKGLPYEIRARARGEYDEVLANQTFTQDSSVSVNMTTYNGLAETYEAGDATAGIVDFTGTVLPYKFEYSNALQTVRYCLMPQGQTYQNVVGETTQTPETLHGCLSQSTEDYGSAQTLSAWAISNEYVVLCPEGFKYLPQQTIGYILGNNANYIGDVSIPQHTVYTYDNGTWTEYTPPPPPSYVRHFTVTGSPTIDDDACTVSGFSSNDYITADTSFSPSQGDDWILRCSFIAPASNGSMQAIAESHGFLFALDSDGFLYFSDSDGTNGDTISINYPIQEGDVINFSVNYNNGGYDWQFYNETQDIGDSGSQVATLTGPVNSSTPVFGVRYGSYTDAFNGTLNMLQCQMIISNDGVESLNWTGYVYE